MAAPTKLKKIIDAAEAKINEDAEGVRSELVKINEALPALREKAQDVKDDLSAEAEVKSRIKRGQDVDAVELVVARAEDEIAEYRLTTTENRCAALTKSLPAESTLIADKIATAFRSVIPGVEVITTIAPLRTWRNEVPEGTTAVVLVAGKVESDPFRQTLSGTVEAYYIRSGMYRPLSVANIEAAHRSAKTGCHMTITANRVGDEDGFVPVTGSDDGNQTDPNALVLDRLTVSVDGVIDGLPVIPRAKANSSLVKTWTMGVFGGYLKTGQVTTARIIDVPDLPEGEAFRIRYGMGSTASAPHPKVSESVEGNERTLIVKHTLNLRQVDQMAFAEEMQDGAQDYVGGSYLDAGVLVSAEATPRVEGGVMAGNFLVDVVLTYKSMTA